MTVLKKERKQMTPEKNITDEDQHSILDISKLFLSNNV